VAVNRILDSLPDGTLTLSDEDWAVQLNLGVLFEPTSGTRFGLTYLSAADLDFSDRVDVSGFEPPLEGTPGLGSRNIDLGMTMPQAVMFSLYHELNDRLVLLANLGWQDWSEFGKVDVAVSDTNADFTTDRDQAFRKIIEKTR
jgi:long-chain fatty acid transport protein